MQYQSNAEAIIQEILARWLQGQGLQPVTWSTLICVLKKVDLWELARMIQKCLIEAQIQENTESQLQLEQQLHAKEENIRKLQQAIRQKVVIIPLLVIPLHVWRIIKCNSLQIGVSPVPTCGSSASAPITNCTTIFSNNQRHTRNAVQK